MIEEPEHVWQSMSSSRPSDFAETVKQLLEHLYDLPFLQQHPLASHPALLSTEVGTTPSQALRQFLMRAVDSHQSSAERTSSAHGRYFKLVYLHYVDGMTIQEAAHNLGVSERQAYRDLLRGIEAVASALWENLLAAQHATTHERSSSPMSVRAEVDRLMPRVSTLDLTALVHYAERAVQKIAKQRNIDLIVQVPAAPCRVRTDEVVAQQLLVRVLSRLVQSVEAATMIVQVINKPRSAEVVVFLEGAVLTGDVISSDALALRLFERLGWSCALSTATATGAALTITVPTDLRFLLLIDDNESLAELLDRYLMNMPYRIVAVTNAADGLRLAQELLPDVIMLDIMMPEMDGWELLQRFRNGSKTADIPIIVCSVFNDPELAFSLGATVFLPKPLSRDQFVDALLRLEAPNGETDAFDAN